MKRLITASIIALSLGVSAEGGAPTPIPAAQNVNLTWQPPTTREDGSQLNIGEIWKYEVWWRDPSNSSESLLAEVPQGSTDYRTNISAVGNVCFWMYTLDTTALKSAKSDEACKTFGGAPGRPTGITIIINGYQPGSTPQSVQ
jgi:hypothetical protein